MTDFNTCDGCGFPSGCRAAHTCNIKRKEREAHLLEVAARELCRMRGEDPDRGKDDAPRHPLSPFEPAAAWMLAADEITRHEQRGTAIAHALRTTS